MPGEVTPLKGSASASSGANAPAMEIPSAEIGQPTVGHVELLPTAPAPAREPQPEPGRDYGARRQLELDAVATVNQPKSRRDLGSGQPSSSTIHV